MNESSNNPVNDRSGIGETITTALRQPSILRVMVGLAATVVVLVGMRLAAPILNPILFAVVLTVLFVGIFLIMGVSIARFSGDIGSYTGKLNVQAGNLQDLAKSLGLSNVDIRDAVKPGALAGAIGSVLSGVADFLSNLFLILIIVLFLLAEGPAMMNRLHASAGRD